MSDIRTYVDVPDGAIPTEVVEVCGYMNDEGDLRYGLRVAGDVPISSIVGLLAMASHDLLVERDDEDGSE